MSVKLTKLTALIVAIFTLLSTFSLAMPVYNAVAAAESVTNINDEASLRAALEGKGGRYSLSADIELTVTEYEEYRYVVKKTISIDLNGHSVTISNTSNLTDSTNDSTLIKVDDGGKLTISDSSADESGTLSYIGAIHKYSEKDDYVDFKVVTGRDLIYVCKGASLTVNGGKLVAGNTEKEWLHRAAGLIDKKFEYYTGFAENTVCGTVITAASESDVTINGGSFEANGRRRQNMLPNLKGWDKAKPASACICAEAEANVVVNDGSFIGTHGADVFNLDSSSNSSIKAGKFETTPSVNERVVDYLDFAVVNVSTYYGGLNLPTAFIPTSSRKCLYQNNELLTTTADAVDGSPIYLIPSTGGNARISSSFSSTSYTPGTKGTLTVGYDPYFSSDSNISYSWYAVSSKGNVTQIKNATESKLDLSKLSKMGLSLSIGRKYWFLCVITETYNGYTLTTVSKTLDLNAKNKSIIAAVSLTPTKIDENNNYQSGSAPDFNVPSNAYYQVDSVTWYESNSLTKMEKPVKLKDNSSYFVVIELSSKRNYVFTSDTRISFFPGARDASIAPSVDGYYATVTAWISTDCSHSSTEFVVNQHTHSKICNLCGSIISSSEHTYTEWAEDGTSDAVAIPMSRKCTVCSHKETSMIFTSVEDDEKPDESTTEEDKDPDSTTTEGDDDPVVSTTDGKDEPDVSTTENDDDPETTTTDESNDDPETTTTEGNDDPEASTSETDEDPAQSTPVGRSIDSTQQTSSTGKKASKTPIYEVKVDFGTPLDSTTPDKPIISSTPDSERIVIDSFTWKTDKGEDFDEFTSGDKYVLTVVFKLADPEKNVFSEQTVSSSVSPSTVTHSLNSDKTELTVKYTITAGRSEDIDITLPQLEVGDRISDSDIKISSNATVYWYKDGKKIGYSKITNGTETDHDADPDDGIDFLTHEISNGSVYYVRINWHVTKGNQVYKSDVNIKCDRPVTRSVVGGEFGFATASYSFQGEDKYIRSISVNDIVEPVVGSKPKTTGATVDSTCTISSVSFTLGSSKVSKFACEKRYTVNVTVTPKSGYTFAVLFASINGNSANVTENGSSIVLSYTFDTIEHYLDLPNAAVTSPTCTDDGSIVAKCKGCSVTSDQITIEKTGHTFDKIVGVTSTCESDGIATHYVCSYCHKLYSDENANTEITIESTVVPKTPDNHTGSIVTVHDGNNHFDVCFACGAATTEEVAHDYGDQITGADGNKYYSCDCGHWVPETGPKLPEFVIGGEEEKVTSPANDQLDFRSISLKTIKIIVIVMIIFIVLLIGAIITISVILFVTRNKSGKQSLPDEIKVKKKVTTPPQKK